MSEPKRYLDPAMYETEDGPWVKYDDYEYAERQAAALRAQVAGLTGALRLMVTAADLVRTEWLKNGNVSWNSPEAEALKSALINHGRKALAEAAG